MPGVNDLTWSEAREFVRTRNGNQFYLEQHSTGICLCKIGVEETLFLNPRTALNPTYLASIVDQWEIWRDGSGRKQPK